MQIKIVPVESLDASGTHLTNWLSKGFNGQMTFLAREPLRRSDPRKIMPDCKSVVVCAMRYDEMPERVSELRVAGSGAEQIKSSEFGVVGSELGVEYLRHEDYHAVMLRELEQVAREIRSEHRDAECKCYVDTGPVLEKAWGERAGLGFIGKNTLLISPEFGSQMALGVVLTNVEGLASLRVNGLRVLNPQTHKPANSQTTKLSTDQRCSNCTACIDACPTKALVAPYTLDARKCISYKFFVEKKEGGCDICQSVCPYNKVAS